MYRVAKGGAITINSFLNESDRDLARDYMLKTASATMREAAKIGLQSLYADPKEVLEKYKDFDIIKEMQARKGAKLLWVRARAIDADVVNANGDYFSKEELLNEVELKGEKIPAYKTFEGVPIYTNHKNDDIEQAKGMVVYAEWDDKDNCVYCTFFVDEEAYPDIARNIRTGVIHDVSMGASVDYGICSECDNKAYFERDYCDCLKKYKGKTHPKSGKKVYEENYNVKFIELSCVGDGAFEACEIQEIYDVDDVLDAAQNLEKKANEICANIKIAHMNCPNNRKEKLLYENCLRVADSTTKTAIKLAQSAGTLVGGPLLAGQGANQNSTVGNILQALGIDARAGLNILDMINLSLNFLEVAVMNMFARKDNVDLTHVGKITKAMADLQSTMQDMIDDGVDVGSGQRAPINQNQQAQQTQQQSNPLSSNVGLADYNSAGNVGRVMESVLPQEPVGGGVALASSNINLVWASKDGKREVYASSGHSKPEARNNVLNIAEKLLELKTSINDNSKIESSIKNVIRMANERNSNIKTSTPKFNEAEDRNQMDHFAKIASEQRKKISAAVTIDFKVEDNSGNRVVLSTDGTISGFSNGKKTGWDPILSETQIQMMESGQGSRVAAELLKEYGSFTKTALLDVKKREDITERHLEEVRKDSPYKSLLEGLQSQHKGVKEVTREQELDGDYYSKRRDTTPDTEKDLAGAGLYGHKVKDSEVKKSLTQLLEDAQKGNPEVVLEEQLAKCRAEGTAKPHVVMSTTVKALARAVVSAVETPGHIVKTAQMLAKEPMLPEMIGTAALGNDVREQEGEKSNFFNKGQASDSSVSAILKQLGAALNSEITAGDLAQALSVAAAESEITKEGVTRLAELLMGGADVPNDGLDVDAVPSKNEELKSALMSAVDGDDNLVSKEDLKSAISAMAMSSEETATTPDEVVDVMASMTDEALLYGITKAKTKTSTDARLRARARREFWGVRTASAKDLKNNVIGWLADYSTNFNISTKSIVTAAKRFVSDPETAERLVAKAIEAKQSFEKTANMKVTQDKSETLRFVCTSEDLGGINPSDDSFDEAFKQKAIQVLQEKGFQVDPGTFSFTDLCVFEDGRVEATVSSRVSKTFDVDGETQHSADFEVAVVDPQMIMTASAKNTRKSLRNEVLAKYAQVAPGMGAPMGGTPPPMGGAPGADMMSGGVSALTGSPDFGAAPDLGAGADMDAISEPGQKKPWGSVCPVCGSDDVNIAESNADCQSCGSTYKILQSIELVSEGGKGADEGLGEEPMGGPDMSGMGEMAAGAPPAGIGGEAGLGAATAPAPMAPMATAKSMFRLATVIDSDVYLRTTMADFDRSTEKRLPLGMVCPKCGDRNAHKVKASTFCYSCGTYSKTIVKANKKNPEFLDASITWID